MNNDLDVFIKDIVVTQNMKQLKRQLDGSLPCNVTNIHKHIEYITLGVFNMALDYNTNIDDNDTKLVLFLTKFFHSMRISFVKDKIATYDKYVHVDVMKLCDILTRVYPNHKLLGDIYEILIRRCIYELSNFSNNPHERLLFNCYMTFQTSDASDYAKFRAFLKWNAQLAQLLAPGDYDTLHNIVYQGFNKTQPNDFMSTIIRLSKYPTTAITKLQSSSANGTNNKSNKKPKSIINNKDNNNRLSLFTMNNADAMFALCRYRHITTITTTNNNVLEDDIKLKQ